ncbi:unnamed protein product [Rotaria sordida]|uniref:Hint domain-containing protein n=1 Tax=Rotaria sordida TaxID=392033 RepID=A0A815WUR8_9BILA|nr:unnamed protein product [Rotaria sordida]CAF1548862.1 unnamed protein product [Rotaria sordida]
MFIFINIILLLSGINKINGDDGRGASASSTDVGVGCFSGDSLVILNNGQQKQIDHLKTADEILGVNHFKIIPSEMIIMLDKQTSKQGKFYTFITDSGHKISLTSLHLIPIKYNNNNKIDYIPAKDLQLNDKLYVIINGKLKSSPVRNITIEIKRGYFAPLTMTGTLFVNNVLSSCYASAKSHKWAHLFLTPFRWYYKIGRFFSINQPFGNYQTDGIHWIFEIIYKFVNYIQPSILHQL